MKPKTRIMWAVCGKNGALESIHIAKWKAEMAIWMDNQQIVKMKVSYEVYAKETNKTTV